MFPTTHTPGRRKLALSSDGYSVTTTSMLKPLKPLKLQDVDEFLLVFLDRLETQLKGLPQKRLLQHVFG